MVFPIPKTWLRLRQSCSHGVMANNVLPSAGYGYCRIKATRGIRRYTVTLMRDLTDRSIDKRSSFPATAPNC
jgi:hypothetical protein